MGSESEEKYKREMKRSDINSMRNAIQIASTYTATSKIHLKTKIEPTVAASYVPY